MLRQLVAIVTLAAFLFSPIRGFSAEDVQHLVPAGELQLQLFSAEEQRQNDLREVETFLARADTQEVLASTGVDPIQITEALPQLDSETLADVAQQSRELGHDVSGEGFLGLIIIVLLLVVVLSWVLAANL